MCPAHAVTWAAVTTSTRTGGPSRAPDGGPRDDPSPIRGAGKPDDEAIADPFGTLEWIAMACAFLVGLVARFVTRSPMWLDEALTVDIASLPVHQIPDALRHDGHPPLYYLLLHLWMKLFGTSDLAVRSLSGIFGVAFLGVLWTVTRRRFGPRAAASALWIGLLLPFAVRYSTEARMYSMVMLLVLLGWIALERALDRSRVIDLCLVAGCTGLLLWTHYWSLWLGVVVASGVGFRAVAAHRVRDRDRARKALATLGALAVGACTFLPWVGVLRYQSRHTGTPWGARAWPTGVIAESIHGLGVGNQGDQWLLGIIVVLFALLGLFATGHGRFHLDLDLRTVSESRTPTFVAMATLGLASAVLMVTDSAFQPRYNAVWIPFALVVAGRGLAQIPHRWAYRGMAGVFALLAAVGVGRNVLVPRTQAAQAAEAIRQGAPGGAVVAVCPDQLGPSLLRSLGDGDGYDIGAYPDFRDVHLIDWVDYKARLAAADPATFATEVLRRAGDRPVYLVWSGSYETHKGTCEAVADALGVARPGARVLLEAAPGVWEPSGVIEYPAPGQER